MRRIIPPKYHYAGVYMIENTSNKKVYIGSSYDIEARLRNHRSALINGTHHCKELQADFNRRHRFVAHVLYVEPVHRNNRRSNRQKIYAMEWKFIEQYDAINSGYNQLGMCDNVKKKAL